ncbi:hypothetical protein BB8028_0004g09410 [Beauveria bassiana]|uniref:Uncharacterized protein n=1 Tax=Beauveria bassiana TaxID=176275 RepID=A0A2S7YCU8_BEABA|nr:hypothetical protein BB8028_0004g09410 [Beauveria bassiana]
MPSSQIYTSIHAAQDVARGACIVAWPGDEPYSEPTSVAQTPRQPRFHASADSTNNITIGSTFHPSTSCPSLASRTSTSQHGSSQSSISRPSESDRSSCYVLLQ